MKLGREVTEKKEAVVSLRHFQCAFAALRNAQVKSQ